MPDTYAEKWLKKLDGIKSHRKFLDARAELERVLGKPAADGFLLLYYDWFRQVEVKLTDAKVAKKALTSSALDGLGDLIDSELARIQGRIEYQDRLFAQATAGRLAVERLEARPESDYYVRDNAIPANLQEYHKAAQWIANGSPNKPLDTAKSYQILRALPIPAADLPGDVVEGTDVAATSFGSAAVVSGLHLLIYGPSNPAGRIAQPVRYPSTFGGRYLLSRAYRLATIPNQSMRRELFWTNWAMYFAAVVGSAQAFEDGNKRVVHALYAAILLNGLGRFLAPTPAVENQLFDME